MSSVLGSGRRRRRRRRKGQPTPVFLPGKIPWTEEPGGLQFTESQRVRCDGAHMYIYIVVCICSSQIPNLLLLLLLSLIKSLPYSLPQGWALLVLSQIQHASPSSLSLVLIQPCLSLPLLVFSHSVVSDSATPWTAARQASLSFTISCSLLKPMSPELMMPSNHLVFRCPLLLLPSVSPSIRVFSK